MVPGLMKLWAAISGRKVTEETSQTCPKMARAPSSLLKQKGFVLAEVLISVAIVGTSMSVLLLGLSSSSVHARIARENVISDNISRGQRTYTFEQPYLAPPASYATVTPPEDWTVTANAEVIPDTDSTTEKIITIVSLNGQVILVVEDIRTDR